MAFSALYQHLAELKCFTFELSKFKSISDEERHVGF
jgi:hypothetical protein